MTGSARLQSPLLVQGVACFDFHSSVSFFVLSQLVVESWAGE